MTGANNGRVAVIANGEWDVAWGERELASVDYLICADGGGNSALSCGRLPDALIGDLDSITPENLELCREHSVEILRYPCEKDETDLELALAFADRKVQSGQDILLYGGAGGRADHFLGNLALLLAYARRGRRIRLKDRQQELWVIQGREVLHGQKKQELSLIVLSETALVTLTGVHYPLNQAILRQDSPRAVSNVFLGGEAVVQIDQGEVLVIIRLAQELGNAVEKKG